VSNFDPIPDNDIVDITTMLRAPDRLEPYLCAAAADEIKRLREERDEARRSCCEFAAMVDSADTVVMYVDSNRFHEIAMKYMKSRGWDCFKENTDD
jgi:hypothetical protein